MLTNYTIKHHLSFEKRLWKYITFTISFLSKT